MGYPPHLHIYPPTSQNTHTHTSHITATTHAHPSLIQQQTGDTSSYRPPAQESLTPIAPYTSPTNISSHPPTPRPENSGHPHVTARSMRGTYVVHENRHAVSGLSMKRRSCVTRVGAITGFVHNRVRGAPVPSVWFRVGLGRGRFNEWPVCLCTVSALTLVCTEVVTSAVGACMRARAA